MNNVTSRAENLTPNQRWKSENIKSPIDNIIKGIGIAALALLGIAIGAATIPVIAIGGLVAGIGCSIIIPVAILAVPLAIGKAIDYFDWQNYSTREVLEKIRFDFTECSLSELCDDSKTAIYRLEKLIRYGLLSEETAEKIHKIRVQYNIYRHNGKDTKEIEEQWRDLQTEISKDLPI
jgi:hypothetical protein